MTLPITRDITLAPGTQIPSTLLNALQDMIIGGRYGPVRRIVPAIAGSSVATINGNAFSLTASQSCAIPLMVEDASSIVDLFFQTTTAVATEFVNISLRRGVTTLGAATATSGTVGNERTQVANIGGTQLVSISTNQNSGYAGVATADAGNGSTVLVNAMDYLIQK